MDDMLYLNILYQAGLVLNHLSDHLKIRQVRNWEELQLPNSILWENVEGQEVPVVILEVLKRGGVPRLNYGDTIRSFDLLNREMQRRGLPIYVIRFFDDGCYLRLNLVFAGDDIGLHNICQRHLEYHLYRHMRSLPAGMIEDSITDNGYRS